MIEIYHTPALLHESVDGMNIRTGSICVDVTFGGGGHSKEILSRLGNKGHLYAFDQDEDAINNIQEDNKFTFIRSNFRFLKNFIKYHGVEEVDAILADLGVSSHHFDAEDRGFSFRFEDSDLDMRMNQKAGKTAAQVLNTYTEEQLADVFYLYGELKQSRRIASAIVKTRKEKPYRKVNDLLDTLNSFVGRGEKEKKVLAQAFQALRIEVNEEMETLKEMLEQALDILKPGGRLVVITYHSLEDRLVKNFFKTGNFEGKVEKDFFGNFETPFRLINNKVIVPSREEEERNPRSRSAKLRIAEKI
ncbi:MULTISPECIES: 16S rRNA (cytosine(1402)-N(4))-methyltransferase RsmH [unclassified Dysgonomonas]|jgi:16S rRNA (cytosine1402-N4)-methyltransferase|uniref:16S rRNA (cytosine(1402)-N(4))-methyltransferase RsmH n=1 Tax=unclassified Dysgonomonas TaxID=2630389 RepID=UPI0025BA0741|nr:MULTISPECIES: 16S rRNA (cytosine(1402)-N(4))-methyltransferase RsmH [unclassified Dysgonomonas]MDR2003188.1 16S rRNA (cytosine(1402)-N(4))-methyltransferase RsmH [Prevotella sp.]HMM02398.1 16S rRNA (cytosine(1402)-N(4))-methyltransferase RsmH [Dysgonomonas sp.]